MDQSHVAIIHCTNGKIRTGVAVACYLRFDETFDNASEAFDYFVYRRSPIDQSWISVNQKRYVKYFNDVIQLDGHLPSPSPLCLHQVLLNSIPNFDNEGSCNPGMEIFQCGKLVYSTVIDLISESHSAVYKDEYNCIFKLPKFPASKRLILEKDIYIRIYHCPDPIGNPSSNVTMLTFSFHTGFMASGLIRVSNHDLEFPVRDLDGSGGNRFSPDFSMDLIFTEIPLEDPSTPLFDPLTYNQFLDKRLAKCLGKLTQYHCVRPDPFALSALEGLHCKKMLGNHNIYIRGL